MTIKELYEKSENVTRWSICVDGGSNEADLHSPVILNGIGDYVVRSVYYHPVNDGSDGVEAFIDVMTEIVTAAKTRTKTRTGMRKTHTGGCVKSRQAATGKTSKALGRKRSRRSLTTSKNKLQQLVFSWQS